VTAAETLTVDPNCQGTRHHSFRSHREHHCTCPGESWDRWMAHRALRNARERPRNRARDEVRRSSGLRRTAPRVSEFEATELDRRLRAHPDLACRDHDHELFSIDGDERTPLNQRQIAKARLVCGGCSALALCREAALAHDDVFMIQGGLTPRERDRIRSEQWGAA
jgi:hypothetical protein